MNDLVSGKVTVSFKIPTSLERELLQCVIADGYGMRGKSIWVIEAIESFLKIPNYPELVEIAASTEGFNETASVRVPRELLDKINQAALEIRKIYPSLEGVKSNMIRASICQRLLRSNVGNRQFI